MISQNGSGFDSYIVLNKLSQWRTVNNLPKKGAGIVSLKLLYGFIDKIKKSPHDVHFRCSGVRIITSLKEIGTAFILQPS